MNFYHLLKQKSITDPHQLFMTNGTCSYTYAQFYDLVSLQKKIWKDSITHQCVVIEFSDAITQLLLFMAVSALGGIPVLLHEELTDTKIEQLMIKEHICYRVNSMGEMTRYPFKARQLKQDCFGVLSSGTTGLPKLMYRSYESWADFFPTQNNHFDVNSTSIVFCQGSLSFTANLNTVLASLFEGATLVMTDSLNPRHWVALIKAYKVNVMNLIPTKLMLLARYLTEELETVTSIFAGSQILKSDLISQLNLHFPKASIHIYYGSTEVSFVSMMTVDDSIHHPMCVGKVLSGVGVEVRDDELFIETPYAISRLKQPFASGDCGFIDEAGYLILLGRKDEVVNVAGRKINLAELKCEIEQLMSVEVCLFTCLHKIKGIEIVAAYESSEPLQVKVEQLNLSYRPHHWMRVPNFPKLSSGKLDRQKLKKLYEDEKRFNG